jgi:hypothetical protein
MTTYQNVTKIKGSSIPGGLLPILLVSLVLFVFVFAFDRHSGPFQRLNCSICKAKTIVSGTLYKSASTRDNHNRTSLVGGVGSGIFLGDTSLSDTLHRFGHSEFPLEQSTARRLVNIYFLNILWPSSSLANMGASPIFPARKMNFLSNSMQLLYL